MACPAPKAEHAPTAPSPSSSALQVYQRLTRDVLDDAAVELRRAELEALVTFWLNRAAHLHRVDVDRMVA